MISTLVIVVCIWLIISIPVALFFGKLFYNLNLKYEQEKSMYEHDNTMHEDAKNIVNQPVKADFK